MTLRHPPRPAASAGRRPLARTGIALALGLLAAGATTGVYARTNVGLVDYAFVDPANPCAFADPNACNEADHKFTKVNACIKLDPASKYSLPEAARASAVRPGDIYEVNLFPVKMESFKADFASDKGQFAIVARAYESSGSPESAPAGLDFRPDAVAGGRVIYYSDDVRQKQTLNFGMVPMFGPVEHSGNPVGVSLFLVEVDSAKDNAKMSALLSTLAGIGRSISVPASPAFNVLESLGTALLNGNRDDLLMRYDTTLRPVQSARKDLRTAFVRYGDYVLIRSDKRDVPIDWSKLHYRPADKRLYSDAQCKTLYDDKTRPLGYGIVQVNRAKAPAYAKTITFGQLREAIDAFEKQDVEAIRNAAGTIQSAVQGATAYRQIMDAIRAVDDTPDGGKPTQEIIDTLSVRLKSQELKDSLEALQNPGAGTKAVFSTEQIQRLFGRLHSLAPDVEISPQTFDAGVVVAAVKKRFGM